jgi:hypothetical protein
MRAISKRWLINEEEMREENYSIYMKQMMQTMEWKC